MSQLIISEWSVHICIKEDLFEHESYSANKQNNIVSIIEH